MAFSKHVHRLTMGTRGQEKNVAGPARSGQEILLGPAHLIFFCRPAARQKVFSPNVLFFCYPANILSVRPVPRKFLEPGKFFWMHVLFLFAARSARALNFCCVTGARPDMHKKSKN